jgi:hypothetical protein
MKSCAAAIVALALASLCACADEGAGPLGDNAYAETTAYYDGFYGAFYGGYWSMGGDFYYFDMNAMRYRRDRMRHFRRAPAEGFRAVQGQAQPEQRRPNRARQKP